MNFALVKDETREPETTLVEISPSLWAALIRYAIAERVNLETAVNQFVRDGLESA
ncbi:hypothetical protein [Bradyrhizobium sp. URHD0069]|uniref:hypothetical protein n=1 Tax=Bradyrhizobium sp. URHD0069 TaxID=1380355 RepID=UPI000B22BA47|nr:hypothetical protein [Bradyrhizobium sp. URHD0069]